MLTVVITGAAAVGVAYLGSRFHLAHLHFLLVVPVGAMLMGAVMSGAVAASIGLARTYDTPAFRTLGTVAALAAYWGAVVLDYFGLSVRLGPFTFPGARVLDFPDYVGRMIRQQGQPVAVFLDKWLTIPPGLDGWIGLLIVALEMIGLLFTVGLGISYLANVPYCKRDRRFYVLGGLIETLDEELVQQWIRAVHERRPQEAKNDFARIRERGAGRLRGPLVRIAVHQCPLCRDTRVRIERRGRRFGLQRLELLSELWLDAARATMLG